MFSIIRPLNLFILIVTQFLVTLFICEIPLQFPHSIPYILLAISSVCITAGGYIINDLYDFQIDSINKPDKQMIGKHLTARKAQIFYYTLSLLSLVISGLLGWQMLLLHTITGILLYLYSAYLKKIAIVGNLLVAFLSTLGGLLPILVLYNSPIGLDIIIKHQEAIIFLAFYSFMISLLREIIKDVQDMEGDKAFGCKTLPILIGIAKTKKILFFLWFVVLFGNMFFRTKLHNLVELDAIAIQYLWYLELYLIFLMLITTILAVMTWKADNKTDFGKLSLGCKIIMLLGLFVIPLLKYW